MNSRERVIAALEHREPDRVPLDLGSSHNCGIHIDAYKQLRSYLGIRGVYEPHFVCHIQQSVCPEEKVLERFGIDTRPITYRKPKNWEYNLRHEGSRTMLVDEYGVGWQKPDYGFYFDLASHPLERATREEIEKYSCFPDPDDPIRYEGLTEEARKLFHETDYAIVADIRAGSVIEGVWFMTGMPRFLMGMLEEPDTIRLVADRCLAIQKRMTERMIEEIGGYIQVMAADGDLGMQDTLLVSPDLYRQFLKPYEVGFYRFVKSKSTVPVIRHSCGDIRELLPDFIECGVDGINPVQVSCPDMDTAELKHEFGEKLVFWGGGCDTQKVLPFGTPKQVREEVRHRMRDLAPGGGFVFGAVHNIQRETPAENICALFDAALEFGSYPIKC